MSDDATSNSTLLTALGANPLPVVMDTAIDELPEVIEQGSVDEDFEDSRERLVEIMATTKGAIDGLLGIAQQSQHPRAYEVLSNLINTYMTQQKDLLDLREKRGKIRKEETAPGSGVQTTSDTPREMHNHLHIGSTSDLQSFIEGIKKQNAGN